MIVRRLFRAPSGCFRSLLHCAFPPSVEIGEYFTKPYPPGKLWLPPAELRSCSASLVPGDERNRGQPRGVWRRSGREAYPATYSGRERNTPQRNPERPCASALEV